MDELKQEDIESVEEFEVNKDFNVEEGFCPSCNKKMEKIIENKDLFDGTLTFHFINFRCQCGKKYLDLKQAEKYDLYLVLEKLSKNKELEVIEHALKAV